MEDETVWLTQRQMAKEELEEAATTKNYLVVRLEGERQVARKVRHYNLGLIRNHAKTTAYFAEQTFAPAR